MNILRSIKDRPFIFVTLLYIVVLLLLDHHGYFSTPPPRDASRFIGENAAEIEGTVISVPEKKNRGITFLLAPRFINGETAEGTILVRSYRPRLDAAEGDIIAFRSRLSTPPKPKNPGSFDYARYLRRKNVYALATAEDVSVKGHKAPPLYIRWANAVRADMLITIDRYIAPAQARLLSPMLIGEKGGLSEEEKTAFADAGVMHVLVVSGFNVAYVAALFLFAGRLAGFSRRRAAVLTVPGIILYVLVTGANPPVLRAGVMALFVIISSSLARPPQVYQSLALAAATILIIDPQSLFSASFQLSFVATIGIVYLYPYLLKPFSVFPPYLKTTAGGVFAVSLSAQLAVLPLIACYFNKISLIGLVSNFIVVPLVGAITSIGLVFYLVHFVSGTLTHILANILSFLLFLTTSCVHYFAGFSHATLRVAAPSLAALAAYYLILWAAFSVKRMSHVIAIALVLIAGGAVAVAVKTPAKDLLTAVFLDVPGSTIVHVTVPGGENWIIGGSIRHSASAVRNAKRTACPYLWSNGVRTIDKVFLIYPYAGGIEAVLEDFSSGELWYCGGFKGKEAYDKVLSDAKEKGAQLREIDAGGPYIFGQGLVISTSPFTLSGEGNRIVFLDSKGLYGAQDYGGTGHPRASTLLFVPAMTRNALSEASLNLAASVYGSETVIVTDKLPKTFAGKESPLAVHATHKEGAIIFSVTKEGRRVVPFRANNLLDP